MCTPPRVAYALYGHHDSLFSHKYGGTQMAASIERDLPEYAVMHHKSHTTRKKEARLARQTRQQGLRVFGM